MRRSCRRDAPLSFGGNARGRCHSEDNALWSEEPAFWKTQQQVPRFARDDKINMRHCHSDDNAAPLSFRGQRPPLSFRRLRLIAEEPAFWKTQRDSTAGPSLRLYGVYCVRSWVVYCDGAGMEGRRFASAMVHGRTSREFPHPTTNVDEESSGRRLRSADRRFGYKLTSVGVHPGSAYLTTKERSCQPH